jgi:hypothetical protein
VNERVKEVEETISLLKQLNLDVREEIEEIKAQFPNHINEQDVNLDSKLKRVNTQKISRDKEIEP